MPLLVVIIVWAAAGLIAGAASQRLITSAAYTFHIDKPLPPVTAIAAITGILFGLLAWRISVSVELLAFSWLATVGVILSLIDWLTHRLPTTFILWGAGILLLLLVLAALIRGDYGLIIRACSGAAILLLFYVVLYVAFPGQLGGGDVRLSGLLGLALAWCGWTFILVGTLLGWTLAAISLVQFRNPQRKAVSDYRSLGPFLIAGAIITVILSTL